MISKTKVLRFSKTTWNRPIVCKLASEYGLTFNILKASILPRQAGRMVLEIMGEEEACRKGIEYLRQCGVRVDPIERGIARTEKSCVHCGVCTALCPTHALSLDRPSMRVQFDPTLCIACGWCIRACPTRAMQLKLDEEIA